MTARRNTAKRSGRTASGLAAALLLSAGLTLAARAEPVTIFAAASTTDAVGAVIAQYQSATGVDTRGVYASSSTLAKQILNGAPADLFLSASTAWMDHVQKQGAILPNSRGDLLGNELVLIAPRSSGLELELEPMAPLAEALDGQRLAIGDPSHVPAGFYAKAALEALGLWAGLSDRLAMAADVRGALALVDRGVAGAGIVYATDAAISTGVRIVGRFRSDSHPAITYPVALVAGGQHAEAGALLAYLRGPEARALFLEYGFRVLAPDS